MAPDPLGGRSTQNGLPTGHNFACFSWSLETAVACSIVSDSTWTQNKAITSTWNISTRNQKEELPPRGTDKFLDMYTLPRSCREDIENPSRPTASDETEPSIQHLPSKKSPGPGGSTTESYQTFRSIRTNERGDNYSIIANIFCKDNFTLRPKAENKTRSQSPP